MPRGEWYRTVISSKGQVVIPKPVREALGLKPGTVLKVRVEGRRVILEPASEPPEEIFVQAGSTVTGPIVEEAKKLSDKAKRLLEDLGARLG